MWRVPPPFPAGFLGGCGYDPYGASASDNGGLPEVFGGGDTFLGPWYPYNKSDTNPDEFIYGAADGVNDGIILVLTSGAEVEKYTK